MNQVSSFLLSGPDPYVETPTKSLGFQFFNRLKERACNDIAIVDASSGETLTLKEFLGKSVKIATEFKRLGLKKGDTICIISEGNVNYFVPVVAALYIGVAVSFLNPDYTIGEIKHGFSKLRAKVILCSKSVIQKVLLLKEEYDEHLDVIFMINEEHNDYTNIKSLNHYVESSKISVENFIPDDVNSSETGAVIYLSSGTTGLPKGVCLTHANFTETMQYFSDPRYNLLNEGDTVLLPLPFFHIFGNAIQLSAILNSLKTIIIPKFKPDVFLNAIQEYKPTKTFLVPAILLFLIRSPLVQNYKISSLKECILGGAVATKELFAEATERLPFLKVRQLYGLTEISGCVAVQPGTDKQGSVGVLVPKIVAKVRDPETYKVLGPMEAGELCFKGPMVMEKYVGDTTSTQSAFDENGFFCSGDVGYYDNDKYFYIVDRIKDLIKYKGFQVSPTELEKLILSHPAAKDCAVVGVPDERAGELPLAFVVKQNGICITEKEIVDYVSERISAQKRLYGGVRFIDQIPRTSLGKIERTKLKQLLRSS